MSESIDNLEPQVPEITPEAAAPVPVEVPERTHVYQPTDESGRSLGGKQVIKYRTSEELAEKLTEQNILLVRKLRETTRKQRLGIQDDDHVPQEAPRFAPVLEFNPRQLSAEERIKLSRDILDPEHFEEASSALFEATVGAAPHKIAQTLTELQGANLRLQAEIESDKFMASTPTYYKCRENSEFITNWMVKHDLAPLRENFQLAYDTLDAAGLLLKAPIVREEVPQPDTPAPSVTPTPEQMTEPTPTNPQSVQDSDGRITVDEPAQAKRPVIIPTGLTRNQAADAGATRPVGEEITYELAVKGVDGKMTGKRVYRGLAALDVMPADEYGRLIRNPKTRPVVEKLEASRGKTA